MRAGLTASGGEGAWAVPRRRPSGGDVYDDQQGDNPVGLTKPLRSISSALRGRGDGQDAGQVGYWARLARVMLEDSDARGYE